MGASVVMHDNVVNLHRNKWTNGRMPTEEALQPVPEMAPSGSFGLAAMLHRINAIAVQPHFFSMSVTCDTRRETRF